MHNVCVCIQWEIIYYHVLISSLSCLVKGFKNENKKVNSIRLFAPIGKRDIVMLSSSTAVMVEMELYFCFCFLFGVDQ